MNTALEPIIPGIANTSKPLNILEPIRVPATASFLPFAAKARAAAISGRLVPIAKTVKPINNSPTPIVSKIFKAPLVINHAARIREAKEANNFRIRYFSLDFSYWISLPVSVLYQVKMTKIKVTIRAIDE